ncbi:SAM domain and HD [Bulinus truncatus]|nr:SAM domain and HD [Bulinus truncatus]
MATKRLDKGRLFNDPVHGHIYLNQTCQLIVDTKEFQRLRYLKQLGVVNYVFAGATHTRFEHSLGSYHIAGKFARKLQEKYPDTATDEDAITICDKDILCVEIAALCHDIGCAPFTKFFFERFLKNRRKKPTKKMFDYMFHEKDLKKKINHLQMNWSQEEKLNDRDFLFIEEMIVGYKMTGSTGWPYKGRDEKKAFLYEIVQNHRNGIDVCKWDYMDRDCRNLGITNNFDAQRYMEFARVIEVDGERQICTRKKEAGNLYNMFFTRYNLHKFAYQHPVVCGIELMLKDVFTAVEHVKIIKSDEVDFTIFECLEDMPAFASLTDEVLYLILHARKNDENDNASLKKAVDLLERLNIRDIYRFIEESSPMSKDNLTQRFQQPDLNNIDSKIVEKVFQKVNAELNINQEEILVQTIYLDFGMKDENPVSRLRFYQKSTPNVASKMDKEETSRLLNGMQYNELRVRVYVKFSNKTSDYPAKCEEVKRAFKETFQ